jgi:hypothetical protein
MLQEDGSSFLSTCLITLSQLPVSLSPLLHWLLLLLLSDPTKPTGSACISVGPPWLLPSSTLLPPPTLLPQDTLPVLGLPNPLLLPAVESCCLPFWVAAVQPGDHRNLKLGFQT